MEALLSVFPRLHSGNGSFGIVPIRLYLPDHLGGNGCLAHHRLSPAHDPVYGGGFLVGAVVAADRQDLRVWVLLLQPAQGRLGPLRKTALTAQGTQKEQQFATNNPPLRACSCPWRRLSETGDGCTSSSQPSSPSACSDERTYNQTGLQFHSRKQVPGTAINPSSKYPSHLLVRSKASLMDVKPPDVSSQALTSAALQAEGSLTTGPRVMPSARVLLRQPLLSCTKRAGKFSVCVCVCVRQHAQVSRTVRYLRRALCIPCWCSLPGSLLWSPGERETADHPAEEGQPRLLARACSQ